MLVREALKDISEIPESSLDKALMDILEVDDSEILDFIRRTRTVGDFSYLIPELRGTIQSNYREYRKRKELNRQLEELQEIIDSDDISAFLDMCQDYGVDLDLKDYRDSTAESILLDMSREDKLDILDLSNLSDKALRDRCRKLGII